MNYIERFALDCLYNNYATIILDSGSGVYSFNDAARNMFPTLSVGTVPDFVSQLPPLHDIGEHEFPVVNAICVSRSFRLACISCVKYKRSRYYSVDVDLCPADKVSGVSAVLTAKLAVLQRCADLCTEDVSRENIAEKIERVRSLCGEAEGFTVSECMSRDEYVGVLLYIAEYRNSVYTARNRLRLDINGTTPFFEINLLNTIMLTYTVLASASLCHGGLVGVTDCCDDSMVYIECTFAAHLPSDCEAERSGDFGKIYRYVHGSWADVYFVDRLSKINGCSFRYSYNAKSCLFSYHLSLRKSFDNYTLRSSSHLGLIYDYISDAVGSII